MEHALAKLRSFWNDPARKPFWKIAYELGRTAWQEQELPVHYLSRCLYRRHVINYIDFIGNRRIDRLHARLHAVEGALDEIPMLEDKLYFQLLFEKAGIRLPRFLGYNCRAVFIDQFPTSILAPADFQHVLRNTLENTASGAVFIKLRCGSQGKGVYKVTKETLGDRESLETLHQTLLNGSYIFQEALDQHPEVSAIYPDSINTIRMDTFVHDDGHAEPLSAIMRFGGNGHHVDNMCKGGCFVAIDFETGRLKGLGSSLLEHGGMVYEGHPTTGFRFDGFQVPFFQAAKSLAAKAALVAPGNRLVGWDIAVLADGLAIVEGNDNYGKSIQEMAYGGYRRHPTFARILEQFGPL